MLAHDRDTALQVLPRPTALEDFVELRLPLDEPVQEAERAAV